MKTGMLVSISQSLGRAAAAAPMTLLALFAGILWLTGLFCGKERRTYVVKLNSQVMDAISATFSSSGEQPRSQEIPAEPATKRPRPTAG
jgi:hypothetical protein